MGGVKFDIRKARQETGIRERLEILPLALDRIEELEGMVIEERAIAIHNFQRYEAIRDAVERGEVEWERYTERPAWSDLPEEQRKAIIEVHREMLHMEGKL
jgi:hypothetical protein